MYTLSQCVVLFSCVALVAGIGSDNILEDAHLDVPGLITKYGYPFEEHSVTTSDGYILGIHRIPHGRGEDNRTDRPVALLIHGLLSSSADYIIMGPGLDLGYLLADEGYDVWMGNNRGNTYSRRHLTLDPDAKRNTDFWRFSWDEMGNYDLPAIIDYALSVTGKSKLHYVGMSQGTTVFFVMGALRPEYNQKIISMQAMGPVAYLAKARVLLLQAIAPFSSDIELLAKVIGIGELLPNTQMLDWAGQGVCIEEAETKSVCSNILFLIAGSSVNELNVTMLPAISAHTPSGSSVRQVVHYGQLLSGKQFQRYDYGWLGNIFMYGSYYPPKYRLSDVTAPVYLYYSVGDNLADVEDVARLYKELGSPIDKYKVLHKDFTHLDFLWGKYAKPLVYDRLISVMRAIDQN